MAALLSSSPIADVMHGGLAAHRGRPALYLVRGSAEAPDEARREAVGAKRRFAFIKIDDSESSRTQHRQKHHKEDVIVWIQACKTINCVHYCMLLCKLKRWWLTRLFILCCQLCCQLCCFVIRLALCSEI